MTTRNAAILQVFHWLLNCSPCGISTQPGEAFRLAEELLEAGEPLLAALDQRHRFEREQVDADSGPGRALKVMVPVCLVGLLGPWADQPYLPGLLVALGPALALDLRERAMLGDGGSNLVGFAAGVNNAWRAIRVYTAQAEGDETNRLP